MSALSIGLLLASFLGQSSAEDAPSARGPEQMATAVRAQQGFEAGLALYAAKDYQAAAARFEEAHRLDPRRDILFAWAQAERLQGNCVAAVPLYEDFLSRRPTEVERRRAQEHLERCRQLLPRHWYQDWVGHGLLVTGFAGLTLGSLSLKASSSSMDAARQATDYAGYSERVQTAHDQRRNAIIGLSVGGAALLGATIHYAWFTMRKRPAPVEVGVDLQRGQVVVQGSF
jgi:tetratricopeptide (TPR) repeat protein